MRTQPAPHSKTTAALLLALLAGLAARPAPAALTDPAQITTEAYVNLVQGDQSLDAGRLEESLALYKTARDYYLQLSRDFPDWEPRVIQYRLTYCENQIIDVERRLAQGQPQAPSEPVPPPAGSWPEPAPAVAAPPPPAVAPERSVETDYLKSRIASLEAELAEFDTLQDELDALSAANTRLQQELAAANQRLDAATGNDPAVLEELRAELAAKDDQIRSLQQAAEASRQREQDVRDLEAKAGELSARNDRLEQEIQTLDAELDDAESRADQAEEQLRLAESLATQAKADLEQARAARAATDSKLAALPGQALAVNPAPDTSQPTPEAVTPAREPEPKPEVAASIPPPARASVPPKAIPDDVPAAEYVRQLLNDGQNESALATVLEARTAAPADMNLALIEGLALIRLQRYSEAAALLIDLAKQNPRHAELHATLGAAMMGAGFYEEARETLLMALKLDKQLPECHYNLAQLYAFTDPIDPRLARRHYQQARNLGLAADPQLEKILK